MTETEQLLLMYVFVVPSGSCDENAALTEDILAGSDLTTMTTNQPAANFTSANAAALPVSLESTSSIGWRINCRTYTL